MSEKIAYCKTQASLEALDNLIRRYQILTNSMSDPINNPMDVYVDTIDSVWQNSFDFLPDDAVALFQEIDAISGSYVRSPISCAEPRASNGRELKHMRSKFLRFTGNLLFFMILLFILVIAATSKMNGNSSKNIGGYSVLNVLSTSMQSEIPKGSLIITSSVDPSTIRLGDDITFLVSNTASVTHRVTVIYNYGWR